MVSFVFEITLLYYVNLKSLLICCLSSGDIHLSFGVSINFSFVFMEGSELSFSDLFYGNLLCELFWIILCV